MHKKAFYSAIILSALLSANTAAAADKVEREKCYGVAKAGKNDCAAKDGSSSCAGQAKKDGEAKNWVYVPKGLCDKLVGGANG